MRYSITPNRRTTLLSTAVSDGAIFEPKVRKWLADGLDDLEGPVDLDTWLEALCSTFELPGHMTWEVLAWAQEEISLANRHAYLGHRATYLREGPDTPVRGQSWD